MTLDSNASPTMILAADRKSPLNVFDEHAARIGAKVVYGNASRPEELDQLAENADAVIVFRTPVSASAIARMKKCKIIVRQGIGFDLVDVPAATRAGIFVSNIPDYCIEEVASHAVALLLSIIRNLSGFDSLMREKGWGFYHQSARPVPPISGMTVGIVGLGKIGRAFARLIKPFGCRVAAYDPYLHQDIFDWMGIERVRQFDELLGMSDALSIHAPHNAETSGLFGKREFALMKKGSFFVNTARGKIVDLSALHDALVNGPLAAAALDVFEDEPFGVNHPILKLKNIAVTPHVAFYSEASVRRVVAEAIEEVIRALQGRRPLNLVNPDCYAFRR